MTREAKSPFYLDYIELLSQPIILFASATSSRILSLDRHNFFSENPGSREDGLQALAHVVRTGDRSQLGLFALAHFAANDPDPKVRRSAKNFRQKQRAVSPRRQIRYLSVDQAQRLLPSLALIGGGHFQMGANPDDDPYALDEEVPAHSLFLNSFEIARKPVTASEFAHYRWCFGLDDSSANEFDMASTTASALPATRVSWYEALDYSRWLTAELRRLNIITENEHFALPTEAQWEKAAKGTGNNRFPWGNRFEPGRCNYRNVQPQKVGPIGVFSPSGDTIDSHIVDMAGNVWEWTSTNWGAWGRRPDFRYPYDPTDGREDLKAPSNVCRVIRGGAFYYYDYCLRNTTRNIMFPDTRHSAGGFRLVKITDD